MFVISDEQAQSYLENGYLVIRNGLSGNELEHLRVATAGLVKTGQSDVLDDPDFSFGVGHKSGRRVLRRIEYVIDKLDVCKVLLANPFVLRSTQKLMGLDIIPTWDAMVIKAEGEGIIVPWHRDAGTDYVGDKPIFNVDFYLDEANLDTCLRVVPGSHKWSPPHAQGEIDRLNHDGFHTESTIPVLMKPGDILFHDILLIHGSPASTGSLRRVIYYEFRTAHVEEQLGPHIPAYIPLKQQVLFACIALRQQCEYIEPNEESFTYMAPPPYQNTVQQPDLKTQQYRFPHKQYWRK